MPVTMNGAASPASPNAYLGFDSVIAILYWPCRWFARIKTQRSGGLLRYL